MSALTREEKQRSAALTAALESLRALTATEYARHLELGSTKAHLMTAEQAAEYDAVYDRITLLVDAWVSEEIDDWHQMVLTLLMDRDQARAERDRLLRVIDAVRVLGHQQVAALIGYSYGGIAIVQDAERRADEVSR